MKIERNEISYYPEIQRFIEVQLKSNFRASSHRDLHVFWGIGELKSNLQRIMSKHPIECKCIEKFYQCALPLSLDIFAIITDGAKFELLILEVKIGKNAVLGSGRSLLVIVLHREQSTDCL
jgi:hypothetical protein